MSTPPCHSSAVTQRRAAPRCCPQAVLEVQLDAEAEAVRYDFGTLQGNEERPVEPMSCMEVPSNGVLIAYSHEREPGQASPSINSSYSVRARTHWQ